ncbi:hypothetical protein D9M71_577700 [compost metagenome]
MEEVIALENPVFLHHPQIVGADERLEDRGGDVRVVVGTQGVADIVEQGADHVFLVATIAPGAGGGLQRVGQAVHGETAEVTFQQLQVRDDPYWQLTSIGAEVRGDDRPVFLRTILHVGKTGIGIHRQSSGGLERHASQDHVAIHDEIAEKAVERVLKGCRTILLEEEMSGPGEAVTGQRQYPQQRPGAPTNGQRHKENDQRRADEVQSSASTVAVFAEVIRVKLSEGVETLDVFHDRNLCGYCSGCKLFCG